MSRRPDWNQCYGPHYFLSNRRCSDSSYSTNLTVVRVVKPPFTVIPARDGSCEGGESILYAKPYPLKS